MQGRLEVEEFPSRREFERKSVWASVCQQEQRSLFPQGRSYGVICMSSKPHHLAGNRCMCVSACMCEAICLLRSTQLTAHTDTCAREHAHHSISHLNKCAIMLGTAEGRLGAAQRFKNQHLTYSATESKLLRKSCTYHGQSNTNNSFASAQNYSWEG